MQIYEKNTKKNWITLGLGVLLLIIGNTLGGYLFSLLGTILFLIGLISLIISFFAGGSTKTARRRK